MAAQATSAQASESGEQPSGAHVLSAQDVKDKHFSATKLRAGYDQDEVDDFLDETAEAMASLEQGLAAARSASATSRAPVTEEDSGRVAELRAAAADSLEEINTLGSRLAEATSEARSTAAERDAATASAEKLRADVEELRAALKAERAALKASRAELESARSTPAPEPAPAPAPSQGESAGRLLELAQSTHDTYVAEAESIRAAARTQADKLLAAAEKQATAAGVKAESEADSIRATARVQADKILEGAEAVMVRAKVEAAAATSDLEEQIATLTKARESARRQVAGFAERLGALAAGDQEAPVGAGGAGKAASNGAPQHASATS